MQIQTTPSQGLHQVPTARYAQQPLPAELPAPRRFRAPSYAQLLNEPETRQLTRAGREVLGYLLTQMQWAGYLSTASQLQLASSMGMARETANRWLGRLERGGFLESIQTLNESGGKSIKIYLPGAKTRAVIDYLDPPPCDGFVTPIPYMEGSEVNHLLRNAACAAMQIDASETTAQPVAEETVIAPGRPRRRTKRAKAQPNSSPPLLEALRAILAARRLNRADIATLTQVVEQVPPELHDVLKKIAERVAGWENCVAPGAAVRSIVIAVLLEQEKPIPVLWRGKIAPGDSLRRLARQLLTLDQARPERLPTAAVVPSFRAPTEAKPDAETRARGFERLRAVLTA